MAFFCRSTQQNPTQLNMAKSKDILNAPFVKGRPLIILFHGYTGHKDYSPNTEIRPGVNNALWTIWPRRLIEFDALIFLPAYLQYGEYNIISVDYHPLAPEPCYLQAVHNLPVVAKCSAQLLDYLIESRIFTLDDIHVIGFSLGAQTSGMIANFIKAGKLKRITGMRLIACSFIMIAV